MQGGPKTILVVDDEPKIRLLLRRCLESDGYRVLEAADRREAELCLQGHQIDLVTLDIQLGSESGLAIAAQVRANSRVPIIMVTGKGDIIDKIVGLEMGADDYITKPFHLREVLARVRSVIRRSETNAAPLVATPSPAADLAEDILVFDGWQANVSRFELTDPAGQLADLTGAEFKLLMIFLQSPKRILSRDQIMDHVNGNDWTPNDRTIDNQVARLRKRIEEDPANPKIIKTIRGVGYMFARDVSTL